MAIKKYEKDGKTFWQVYVDLRSRKDRSIRAQQRINGLESEREAIAVEKRLARELTERLQRLEAQGAKWEEVVEKWVQQQKVFPTGKLINTTLIDYEALLRNWTKPWFDSPASEISRADVRELFRKVESLGKSQSFRQRLKAVINQVYTWGMEERMISGVQQSPAVDVAVTRDREERRPEILSIEQIRLLLSRAKHQRHPWYPVWVMAALTGCRSGELHQLRRGDIEIAPADTAAQQDRLPSGQRRYGFICVRRSWNSRLKRSGPTKAGSWRNVPISSELYWFLMNELQIDKKGPGDFLLPRFKDWDKGEQARILRVFCVGNHLPSVRFHTLRACFATQLISMGVPPTVVMKICGWKDLKTMQRYIRLAGVDEAGATEGLRFLLTDEAIMEEMADLIGKRS